MPERKVVTITREEVAARKSPLYHRNWRYAYHVPGVLAPYTRLPLAIKAAKIKHPGAVVRCAWKEQT